jgi:hypothetical protein
MKTENWKDIDPKNKLAEPSEEQQFEENHLSQPDKKRQVTTEVEEEEDDMMEESDDDDDVRDKANTQVPEFNTNLEQNRSQVDEVKELEGAESNKITNRETDIVNKEGQ